MNLTATNKQLRQSRRIACVPAEVLNRKKILTQVDLIAQWKVRNLFLDSTPESELVEHLSSVPRTFYVGFDPTAESLHIGSLMPLVATRRLQLAGHRPIVLVGGGTGLIGDPSGKVGERTLNAPATVAACSISLKRQISRFIEFDAGHRAALLVDNYEWLSQLEALTFLRDIGKHFSVNAMLGKESVKSRIERDGDGISFTEFSYMILQAYDYLMLYKRYGTSLQIGGSDQWGNITAGIELIRRALGVKVHGLTLPLVSKSDGTKFGKTESGTIWLDPHKTSPYEMYQFWLGSSDRDVARFLAYFTFLPMEEIADLNRETEQHPERRVAQQALANEVTRLVHGEGSRQEADRITNAFFHGDLEQLSASELTHAVRSAPHHVRHSAEGGMSISDALVVAKLAPSRTRARELVDSRCVTVNGVIAADSSTMILPENALFGKFSLIRRGKKSFFVIVWKDECSDH